MGHLKQLKCRLCKKRRLRSKFYIFDLLGRQCDKCLCSSINICYSCFKHECQCQCNMKRELHIKEKYQSLLQESDQSSFEKKIIDAFAAIEIQRKPYRIIKKLFTPEECGEILLQCPNMQEFQPINFGDTKRKAKRFQTQLGSFSFYKKKPTRVLSFEGKPMPKCLYALSNTLKKVHVNTEIINYKLLKSEAGCERQQIHADDLQLVDYIDNGGAKRKQVKFEDQSFSILIALQATKISPTSFIRSKSLSKPQETTRVQLPQGDMVIWKGYYPHAGSEYEVDNTRLFVSVGTKKFRHLTNDVSIYSE